MGVVVQLIQPWPPRASESPWGSSTTSHGVMEAPHTCCLKSDPLGHPSLPEAGLRDKECESPQGWCSLLTSQGCPVFQEGVVCSVINGAFPEGRILLDGIAHSPLGPFGSGVLLSQVFCRALNGH